MRRRCRARRARFRVSSSRFSRADPQPAEAARQLGWTLRAVGTDLRAPHHVGAIDAERALAVVLTGAWRARRAGAPRPGGAVDVLGVFRVAAGVWGAIVVAEARTLVRGGTRTRRVRTGVLRRRRCRRATARDESEDEQAGGERSRDRHRADDGTGGQTRSVARADGVARHVREHVAQYCNVARTRRKSRAASLLALRCRASVSTSPISRSHRRSESICASSVRFQPRSRCAPGFAGLLGASRTTSHSLSW
jgi:hypothetical protein